MQVKLTSGFVATADAPSNGKDRIIYWDNKRPGFGLMITAAGKRSYVFQYRNEKGESRRATLSGTTRLPDAHKWADIIQGDLAKGGDPVEKKRRERAAQSKKGKFRTIAEDYVKREKASTGDISPTLLLNEVRKANPNFAYGSGGDIADIARIGQRFMRQPPDSGTPLGTKVLDAFTHSAPALAGAALGGGAAYNGGFDPTTDIGLGVGGLLATAAMARGAGRVMLRPQMIENALTRSQAFAPPVANRLLQNNSQEERAQ